MPQANHDVSLARLPKNDATPASETAFLPLQQRQNEARKCRADSDGRPTFAPHPRSKGAVSQDGLGDDRACTGDCGEVRGDGAPTRQIAYRLGVW